LIGVFGPWKALRFEYTDGIEPWERYMKHRRDFNIKETPSPVLELLERKKGRIVNDMDISGFQ
jgi:hypothetical protein